MSDRRPVIFGEVLFDCFPDGARVLGGAPFNVAWHLRALGLDPFLVSRVGRDAAGAEVKRAMSEWGMDCAGVQSDATHPTGRVAISLRDGQPHYQILPDQAYDHIAPPEDAIPRAVLVYHGSLAARHPDSSAALSAIRAVTDAPVFVDVNLRDPWWTAPGVARLLDGARWCKLNDDELKVLAGAGEPTRVARRLQARHGIARVYVTLGAAGALAVESDGRSEHVAPADGVTVVDTVGAGDAFAATLIAGLIAGWSTARTLHRAQHLATAICGVRGALARNRSFYEHVTAEWEEI